MKTFPAFFDLAGRAVVIVGAGEVASRKARLAGAAGARVIFAGSGLDPALVAEWGDRAEFDARPLSPSTFEGAALAFIAVENAAEAVRLAVFARAADARVNVADRPDLSDFILPAIVDRGDVVVAISTGGASPALGRRLREKIESLLPHRLASLAAFARAFRSAVAARIAAGERRGFWERVLDGPIASRVLAGDERGAREAMLDAINRPKAEQSGVVHIVGAGPGDPDLLTLKALRLLQSADVILHDRLIGAEILALCRREAELFYVGKAKGAHAVAQPEIEQRLIDHARQGKIVVRLKGGDPFIFGRGGEEFDAVKAAGIPVFVTPGVTAATGCAAAAAMPLTHRGLSQAVTFVTGHAMADGEPDLDWTALASLGHTLVVYMGAGKADWIAEKLIEAGRARTTPVAVIEKGTTANEKILKGALSDLGALVHAGDGEGPALLVIGEVAAKADGATLADPVSSARRAA